MTGLTDEERAEFTLLNMAAFSLAREEAAKKNTVIPCWLVTSEEARERIRADFVEFCATARFLEQGKACTREWLEKRLNALKTSLQGTLEQWIESETEFKRLREEGNARAYFA